MSEELIRVPDIGDFSDVDVIEVLVAAGDEIEEGQSLITLESDKASMEIPAPKAGTVLELLVEVGSKVSTGSPILRLESDAEGREEAEGRADSAGREPASAPASAPAPGGGADLHTSLLVLGGGPGGYTAAFRAADLGLETLLVERHGTLGGVCLNVGCIPSKALLHVARVLEEAAALESCGVAFGRPELDLDRLRGWKDGVVQRLTSGLAGLARQRKVKRVQGWGQFLDSHRLLVEGEQGRQVIAFEKCIVAVGSRPVELPFLPADPRIIDSTGALELPTVPERLLVIGGGIIGLEMATVYRALGSRITIVEMQDSLIPGADRDMVRILHKHLEERCDAILTGTRVASVEAGEDGLEVAFEGGQAPDRQRFDQVLVAVGRRPNGDRIAADKAGIRVDEHGFIPVDGRQRTNVEHIHAIGDVTGQPMLAHKASHEGKVAAEACAGQESQFEARSIPSVAYTDPEVAWTGPTEEELRERGVSFETGVFPWAASGRALSVGRPEGATKLLCEKGSGRVLGAAIVGPGAGELIAEIALAIEMGCVAGDIALTVHPHPTLSETVGMAAEMIEKTITDLYLPRR